MSRYAGQYEHVFEATTAGVTLQAPQLDINTVAAGGGSRLFFRSLYISDIWMIIHYINEQFDKLMWLKHQRSIIMSCSLILVIKLVSYLFFFFFLTSQIWDVCGWTRVCRCTSRTGLL